MKAAPRSKSYSPTRRDSFVERCPSKRKPSTNEINQSALTQEKNLHPNPIINRYFNETISSIWEKRDVPSHSSEDIQRQLETPQTPDITNISCSDSRFVVLGAGNEIGKRFLISNVANLMPECDFSDNEESYHGASAALQHGIANLKTPVLIVSGHSGCGGIASMYQNVKEKSFLTKTLQYFGSTFIGKILPASWSDNDNTGQKEPNFIGQWMKIAAPAKKYVDEHYGHLSLEEQTLHCELQALMHSRQNLLTYPFIKRALADKKLEIIIVHVHPRQGLRYAGLADKDFKFAYEPKNRTTAVMHDCHREAIETGRSKDKEKSSVPDRT
jgi:carbonic anhydrase